MNETIKELCFELAASDMAGRTIEMQRDKALEELNATRIRLGTVERERNDALRQNEKDLSLQAKLDDIERRFYSLKALYMESANREDSEQVDADIKDFILEEKSHS